MPHAGAGLRLVEHGPGEPLKNSGWAQLADPAGNVWLSEIQGKLPSYFHLWRDGKITQQLEISGYESGGILFSDRPGSVYANTPVGLQHWVAEEPEFKTFRYDRTYGMSKVAGKTTRQSYNKRDTLLLETYIDTPERTCAVYFIKIPPSDD